ncbi:MAG: ferrous iron transport protein B [Firmicutes bacterium]|nr:ferrous iron transport protein B [Bacillota bacterium]
MHNKKIALAGNPNVGKSTIFNSLTHSREHTGNWAGKTVGTTEGIMKYKDTKHYVYDLPGIYSLLPHSEEERIARDFLIFDDYDFIIVVCDASSLLRNLNLVLQLKEINKDLVLCLNLIDEAKKKNISINKVLLEKLLDIKVIETCGFEKNSLNKLKEFIYNYKGRKSSSFKLKYSSFIEDKISYISSFLDKYDLSIDKRWLSLNILRRDEMVVSYINNLLNIDILSELEIGVYDIDDEMVECINNKASDIYNKTVSFDKDYSKDRVLDKIFTSKSLGIPIMLLFLGLIFLLTIKISNYPSSMLFSFFSYLEDILFNSLIDLGISKVLVDLFVNGVYKVTTWVISVMLPPMMIFFPLFTLLEDFGYLPRIAFNLDGMFSKCSSCGKQALTMAMGFGCNCVGVTGCRIIDSKRERLIAILTNVFIPCNGKFPTIIALISMFFVGINSSLSSLFLSTGILLLIILFCVLMTFLVSKILSMTILSGYSSSFVLELTPYRRPRIMKTIITSIFERTLFVLGRAVIVAIPCGFIIWCLANINISGISILNHLISFFNPFGNLLGLDGVIILSFLLGFPANEIIMPIMLMCYLNSGSLVEYSSLFELRNLLIDNGWTILTAVSVIILFLFHYPCSTACLTIKKETDSWYYTFLSIVIPTFIGVFLCFIINLLF